MMAERVDTVSSGPGVYLMKNDEGLVIYVGKAKNLKKRLASYFKRENQTDMKTGVLVKQISQFDTILTNSEQDALILEANLIRKYKPRYNMILKDDKRYPLLRIDITTHYPNITIARKIKKDGALYFGPYASAGSVHKTLKFINKTFKLRKCTTQSFKNRARPCLNYQMGICLAPCCFEVDPGIYREIIDEVALFLKGKTPELIRQVKQDMAHAAQDERFEDAAQLRDKVYALEKTLEKQVVVAKDMMDRDIIAISRGDHFSLITLLSVRAGILSGSRHFPFKETMADDSELVGTFIVQYYENAPHVPGEILLSVLPDDHDLLTEWLKGVKKTSVRLYSPQRGEKLALMAMALNNSAKEREEMEIQGRSRVDLLFRLKNRLGTRNVPEYIECFDNSNISGTEAVSAMVVFKNGKPFKSGYRKYKIKTVTGQDDYSYMAEVLLRRYGNESPDQMLPDLLMVDGGKGQLNIALSVLKELGMDQAFDVIGIAKKDEAKGEIRDKIYKAKRSNPVNFGRDGDLLLFLQNIRDEAHRFVITFHRARRDKKLRLSVLDSIPGIGPKRKTALLLHFGGLTGIMNAREEDLCAVEGMTASSARAVLEALGQGTSS
ncbi:MAG: excinuclease ABC subunit UvrC [Proteobacteria bacterium]|nr:excinuclease ABC subunit UvrC [Pseudomonadota bacterium]